MKVATTALCAAIPLDESRLLALAAADAGPEGSRFVADLVRLLKEAGFDNREMATELQFGIIQEPAGPTFLTLINLRVTGMYATHGSAV